MDEKLGVEMVEDGEVALVVVVNVAEGAEGPHDFQGRLREGTWHGFVHGHVEGFGPAETFSVDPCVFVCFGSCQLGVARSGG